MAIGDGQKSHESRSILDESTRKAAPPPEAAHTRDHTPQNGACETGVLSISQATAKANRFKRDRSTHSRFQCPVFSLWALPRWRKNSSVRTVPFSSGVLPIVGSRNISPHPEHFHATTMPPSWLNATRCSTQTVYAVRLCHKSVEIETKRPTCGYASTGSSSVRPALSSRRNIRCSNRALIRRYSVAAIVPSGFARLCVFLSSSS